MPEKESVLSTKVIDNQSFSMVEALEELLPVCSNLNLAVGYFYLSGYRLVQEAFNDIALRGKVRIIMGNKTNKITANEINQGLNKITVSDSVEALTSEIQSFENESSEAFSAYFLRDLIALKKVEIKIYTGDADYFHAKAYLIGRENSSFDGYALVGSSNFSHGGLRGNTELNVLTMDSYCQLNKWFENLWNSNDVKDFSIDLIQIIECNIKRPRRFKMPRIQINEAKIPNIPHLPSDIFLREYQIEAIDKWFENNGRGTFKMATGSGKTITSLGVVERSYRELGLKAVIIIAPYKHLVSQWAIECRKFNLDPICCFDSYPKWASILQSRLYGLQSGTTKFLTVITTNSTFIQSFQHMLPYFPEKTLLIGDEAHNLGSKNISPKLPNDIKLRLALSATPERWFDDSGTKEIFDYFGEKLIEFTLKDALDCKALVKYRYHPLFVELDEDEYTNYQDISKQISKYSDDEYESDLDSPVKILLNKRAKIVASAKSKIIALKNLMENRLDTSHTLIYCGDGSVEEPVSLETDRQINVACRLLGYELGFRVDMYVADTPLEERENIREKFDNGELQGIVAIRCLDEGVDIPSTSTAIILASSSNPKQFIQRRGRVLRKYPGKTSADIFDMIVLPPKEFVDKNKSERSLLIKEFSRYIEFSSLASNSGEAIGKLSDIKKAYGF